MNTTPITALNMKKEKYRIEPAKLNIWLFMLASSMLFAAFVSAFIVHQPDAMAKNTWTIFELPVYFMYSVVTVIISSVTMFIAWRAAKNDELSLSKFMTLATLGLGILFGYFQFMGWQQMVSMGLTFVNAKPEDISASYVWVITALHALHVFGGIVLLAVLFIRSLQYKVHKKQMTLMSVTHTYWHFVGLLWIYLYLFLYFAR